MPGLRFRFDAACAEIDRQRGWRRTGAEVVAIASGAVQKGVGCGRANPILQLPTSVGKHDPRHRTASANTHCPRSTKVGLRSDAQGAGTRWWPQDGGDPSSERRCCRHSNWDRALAFRRTRPGRRESLTARREVLTVFRFGQRKLGDGAVAIGKVRFSRHVVGWSVNDTRDVVDVGWIVLPIQPPLIE